jgi:hypothetical protein
MATHDYVIANASGAAVRSDLNNALAAIVSNNSNATAPATTYAYMWWVDTTNGQLKQRNAANDDWIVVRELDGTMLMEDGTAAAPGLAFASDLDTGFYRPANNELGIATNGSSRMTVSTTAVTSTLPVTVNSSGSTTLRSDSTGVSTLLSLQNRGIDSAGDGIAINFNMAYLDGTVRNSGAIYCLAENNHSTVGTSVSSLAFAPAAANVNTERARITSSGQLLVGTSTARSVGSVTAGFEIEGTNYSTSSLSVTCNSSTGESPTINLGRSNGSSIGSNTGGLVAGDDLGYITFGAADGTDLNSRAAWILCEIDGATSGDDVPGRIIFSTTADGASSPTERMRIRSDGRLLCPGVYAETTGSSANVNVQADGLLQRSVSSIKYKTNVETLQDSYADALLDCRPVWYQSKCASDNRSWGYWGFIAEELAEIDPRLVSWKTVEVAYDDDGSVVETPCDPEPEGVQYDRFVPHLLNLIKRQKEQIEAMEARLSALEGA